MRLLLPMLDVALDAAPWLLLGLLAAALIHALIPDRLLQRWVGGDGIRAVTRAAVIGAPVPLCSCGAIPTALALHRGGAGRGPTTAFLIGTPGIGVDSLSITYALLGPFMAVVRALGAVVTAVATGLLVGTTGGPARPRAARPLPLAPDPAAQDRGLGMARPALSERLHAGMHYAFGELWDDISTWVFAGLLLAGILLALVPSQALAGVGSGLLPMLLVAVIGVPLYICAAAATPIAAAMLLTGVSPGTALIFLLAGPITSLATLGVLRRAMGSRALVLYLVGVIGTSLLLGVLLDVLVAQAGIDVLAQLGTAGELLPAPAEWVALAVLVLLAVRPVRRAILGGQRGQVP
jgi:uncharacterized protein